MKKNVTIIIITLFLAVILGLVFGKLMNRINELELKLEEKDYQLSKHESELEELIRVMEESDKVCIIKLCQD